VHYFLHLPSAITHYTLRKAQSTAVNGPLILCNLRRDEIISGSPHKLTNFPYFDLLFQPEPTHAANRNFALASRSRAAPRATARNRNLRPPHHTHRITAASFRFHGRGKRGCTIQKAMVLLAQGELTTPKKIGANALGEYDFP
jgi:hypothetical protein